MKINLRVRFKNKTFVFTFATVVIAFVYQLLGLFGVTPKLSQNDVVNTITILINLLATLGVLVDPTTPGINDSLRAQNYTELGGSEHDVIK